MSYLLLTNAILINEQKRFESDILIKNGRIENIAPAISAKSHYHIIDANGKIAIPGMIDDQVHFREPGLTHKADIHSESTAALAGGITSFMDMPNNHPPILTRQALADKYALTKKKAVANYAFYMGSSNDNLEEIKALQENECCAIKIFMGASTGNMLVDNPKVLENIFSSTPHLIATHCEDTPTIVKNEAHYRKLYGENIDFALHPEIRSEAACYLSSSFAVALAKKYNTRLHVLHITTAKELALFSSQPLQEKLITAEACVHHLFFNADDYAHKGALIKCNPAIKTKQDQSALLHAVKNNIIDIIATDHAPHTWEEKQRSYFHAPSGLPLVQDALLSLLEFYHQGQLSLEQIVNKTSHAVAERFKIIERGYLRENYWADIVLLDLNTPHTVTKENILYKCGWSPFQDYTFCSSIDTTIVSGQLAWQKGKYYPTQGQRLAFRSE